MHKGIFWRDHTEKKLITKKVACDYDGAALGEAVL